MSGPESAGEATALDDLIARLEAATGPDPRLDAEIEAHIRGGVPAYRCHDSTRTSYGPSAVFKRDDGSNILSGDWWSAPSLTGSLDAAVTLVDGDYTITRRTRHPYNGRWPYEATVWATRQQGFADTAPLALCIAALARTQESGHE